LELYTNHSGKILEHRLDEICKNTDLYISVAFFSNYQFIEKAIKNGCNILLIIRLDIGTNPDELMKIIDDKDLINNISIRYYSSREFHPKFYIIDNECAIIGSSNLTHSGLLKNLEVNIEIEKEDPIFSELKSEFNFEWDNAFVLTKEKILEFKKALEDIIMYRDDVIYSKIGEVKTPNINSYNKINRSLEITEKFRKNYQLYINAFNHLMRIYTAVSDKRKYNNELPMRIEIDRFLSWIKDSQYKGEEYKKVAQKADKEIEQIVSHLKNEFIEYISSEYYNNTLKRYTDIISIFESAETLNSKDEYEILDKLLLINAIGDQLRFHKGGLETLKEEFLRRNNEEKIKYSLTYLLSDSEDFAIKIYNLIYLPKYKLSPLAESSIKELYGYINNSEIPTCNDRLLHSMQWLGYGKL